MGIISWIVLGAIAGFIANMLVGGGEGVIGTIILGIVGAIVGGYIASALFHPGDVSGGVSKITTCTWFAMIAARLIRQPRRWDESINSCATTSACSGMSQTVVSFSDEAAMARVRS